MLRLYFRSVYMYMINLYLLEWHSTLLWIVSLNSCNKFEVFNKNTAPALVCFYPFLFIERKWIILSYKNTPEQKSVTISNRPSALSTQGKIFSKRHIEIFFISFPGKRIRHFIQIVSPGGGGTHYISMGRDVPTKGVLFSVSGTKVCFIVKNLGRDSNILVWKRGSCLSEKGW